MTWRPAELTELFRKTWRTFIVREQKLYASLLATADVFCATAVGSGASKVLNVSFSELSLSFSLGRILPVLATDLCSLTHSFRWSISRSCCSTKRPCAPRYAAICKCQWVGSVPLTETTNARAQPVSLIPLMKGAQHATLIGDHKQLPAVVTVCSLHLMRGKGQDGSPLSVSAVERGSERTVAHEPV